MRGKTRPVWNVDATDFVRSEVLAEGLKQCKDFFNVCKTGMSACQYIYIHVRVCIIHL